MATDTTKRKRNGQETDNGDPIKLALADKRTSEEEARLEKELSALDEDNNIPGLEDTAIQRLRNPILAAIKWDEERSRNRFETRLAREAGDSAERKRLVGLKPNIMKHLNLALNHVVTALFEEEELRQEVNTWRQIPENLRPVIAARLKAAHKIHVQSILDETKHEEEEERQKRAQAGEDEDQKVE